MPDTEGPQTLIEAVRHFSDLDACSAYMVEIKWPTGIITCPKCGSDNIGPNAVVCTDAAAAYSGLDSRLRFAKIIGGRQSRRRGRAVSQREGADAPWPPPAFL